MDLEIITKALEATVSQGMNLSLSLAFPWARRDF